MNTIPGYQITEQISESSRSIVYRGMRDKDNQAVILKVLKQDNPSQEELARYRQEYEFTLLLANIEGVVNSYSLKKYQNSLVICFEDIGGESLKKWLDEQRVFPLDELLSLAIQITGILEQIHGQNIIHKHINPSNLILNPTSGLLKIIDFGMATQLSKQHLTLKKPYVLEGDLAYISPEQTGRMNCVMDYRSDLYSLGVTLYELFAGVTPFDTTDAIELIHCHIAKQPKPPLQINPDLPPAISNLILKLLEKNVEARYQSHWGLKTDLEQCLKQWQSTGQIESFPLARFDLSAQFQIPQKLYGRENEIQTLLSAFERVTSRKKVAGKQGQPELMLITGYSGIGKTVLVKEIYKSLAEKQGCFISGKFDQLQRNIPYSAIVYAFKGLIQQLLTEKEEQLSFWKEKLLSALGHNGQVIIDVIPDIELIVGPQPAAPLLGPTESQNRFNLIFQNFIHVFCQPDCPMVIFLDDLQWVDSATLKLIESVLMCDKNLALLLIGAYRDNEVGPTHPLVTTLDNLRKRNITYNQITLAPLAYEHVNNLIADSLHQNLETVGPLTNLVMQKTNGNPFFLIQFLDTLVKEGRLLFVPPSPEQKGNWQWDLKQIETLDITDNVIDLMMRKVNKLPESSQLVIRLAACVGNHFDLDTISVIYNRSVFDTFQDLQPILEEGLITALSEPELTNSDISDSQLIIRNFRFLHDRIQQAAYSLIKDENKIATHLQAGRLLLQKFCGDDYQNRIFELADHYNIALENIKDDHEKIDIASLFLTAGDKASAAMASEAALSYYTSGLYLLSEKRWEEQYSLSLNLTCGLIESTYLTSSYKEAENLCHLALAHAQNTLDKARIYSLMGYNFTLQNKMVETLTMGLDALKMLNIPVVENPPEITSIEQLRDLPEMTNPESLAAMRILVTIISCALVTQSPLMMPLIYTMVNLSTKLGNCSRAPFGYVWYGCTLCWSRTDIRSGYLFGRLAIDIMEKYQSCEVKTMVLHQFNSFIRHWYEHERFSIDEFPKVVQIGKETGDIEYGTYVAVNYVTNLLLIGEPLVSVLEKQRPYLDWVRGVKFSFSLMYGSIFTQATQCLMNQGNSSIQLKGDFIDEDKSIPLMRETKNNLNLFAIYAAKSMLSYFNEEFYESVAFAKESEEYEEAIGGLLPVTIPPFYGALALLKITSKESFGELNSNKTFVNYENKLQIWSENSPNNFQHKYHLVRAEKARVFGDNWEAVELYEKAIAGAKENEYLHEEALSYELASEFYSERGMDKIAQTYMKYAYLCYQQWGALAKVKKLEIQHPKWLTKKTYSPGEESSLDVQLNLDPNSIDLNSLMKATQTLSEEIVLSHLLNKMMHIVIENAGAENGFLLLLEQDRWFVKAQRLIDHSETITSKSLPLEESEQVSANIIHYVARTRKTLVLNDATHEGSIVSDAYIAKQSPKSVLCMPLINQGQLTGILYLENNLMTGAFTPERLVMLNLLSSQIANSITNSFLYSNLEYKVNELQQENTERKRAEEELQASEEQYRNLTESLSELIYRADPETFETTYVNSSIERLYGYTPEEWLADSSLWERTIYPEDRKGVLSSIEESRMQGEGGLEYRMVRKDGAVRWVEDRLTWVKDSEGKVVSLEGVVSDITDKRQTADQIRYLAYFDALTGLPNRKLFFDRLNQGINRVKRNEQPLALLYIDLDNFKNVNDTLGHPIGDMLLKAVGERLSETLRKSTTVSRLGGDEFAVIIEDMSDQLDVINVADTIIDSLKAPLVLSEHEVFVFASLGIAIYPNDGEDVETLLKNADRAMYHAKKQGKNSYQFFAAEMNVELEKRMRIETKLRHAFERNEFSLHYQPQFDLEGGLITGVESLIRWYPDGGELVSPMDFIPVAEETSLILEIDRWVLHAACTQMKLWQEAGFINRRISVNISGLHFRRARILETVATVLEETGLKPDCLEIEITEGVLMEDVEEAVSTLGQLRSMGINIAVDDFGTGYSSLSYLKRFPINRIKIDRSFINDVMTDQDSAAITRTIIAMAQNLNREVIAEGVETKEQLEFLRAEGCNQVQGYYFSKPLPADEFKKLIEKQIN